MVELVVTLHDSTFTTGSEPLQLTCTEGLSLSGETLSDDGRLISTDADSDKHELCVILSAFATLADTSDSSLCHEVTFADTCDSSLFYDVILADTYK